MKFKKVPYIPFFSKYVREDGEYIIIAEDRNAKTVFVVYDRAENEIDVFKKLKEAKEHYA